MAASKAFGWSLHVSRCATWDDPALGRAFSVNLLLPWGNPEDATYNPGAPTNDSSTATWDTSSHGEPEQMAPGLFRPWKWTFDASPWRAFRRTTPGTWEELDHVQVMACIPLPPAELTGLRDAVDDDFTTATRDCSKPFSTTQETIAIAHNAKDGYGQSMAHLACALTHQVAVLTRQVLGMNWMLHVDGLADTDTILLLPSAQLENAMTLSPTVTARVLDVRGEKAGIVWARLASTHNGSTDVQFVTNTASVNDPADVASQILPAAIELDSVPVQKLESLAIAHLNPISLFGLGLARVEPQQPGCPTIEDLAESLATLWGLGFEALEQDERQLPGIVPRHVAELSEPLRTHLASAPNTQGKIWQQALFDARLDASVVPRVVAQFCDRLKAAGLADDYAYFGQLDRNRGVPFNGWHDVAGRVSQWQWTLWRHWLVATLVVHLGASETEVADITEALTATQRADWFRRMGLGAWDALGFDPVPLKNDAQQTIENGAKQRLSKVWSAIEPGWTAALQQALDELARATANARAQPGVDHPPRLYVNPGSHPGNEREIQGIALCVGTGVSDASGKLTWGASAWVTQHELAWGAPRSRTRTRGVIAQGAIPVNMSDGRPGLDHGYEGRPWSGSGAPDMGTPVSIRPVWSSAWEVPALGFGLVYRAAFVPMNNVGAPVPQTGGLDRSYPPVFPQAEALLDDLQPPASTPYLSRVKPNRVEVTVLPQAPFTLQDMTELGAQSRALATLQDGEALTQANRTVHMLQGPNAHRWYTPRATNLTLRLDVPRASVQFYERWIAGDLVRRKAGIRDGLTPSLDAIDLLTLTHMHEQAMALQDTRITQQNQPDLQTFAHPAVCGYGISVTFNDRPDPSVFVMPLAPHAHTASLVVEGATHSGVDAGAARVSVAPGEFAAVRVFALIEEHWFSSPGISRFTPALISEYPLAGVDPHYRWFSPHEFLFEVVPDLDQVSASAPLTLTLPILVDRLDTTTLCVRNEADVNLDQIAAVSLTSHVPEWSGLPVQFPADMDGPELLAERLLATANSATRPQPERKVLTARRDRTSGTWTFPAAQALWDRMQPAERGARLLAVVARPEARFAKWLLPGLVKTVPRATMKPVRGASSWVDHGRLPPPVLMQPVALTSTLQQVGNTGMKAGTNGCLMLFDEAIYRTDDLARYGGIGEVLELEVEDARQQNRSQAGVNPIVHPLKDNDDLGVKLSMGTPFGLSQDLVAGGLQTQTAVIVTPGFKAGSPASRWILAKTRVRRMVLPETLEQPAAGVAPPGHATGLRVRPSQGGWVPYDFCLDCTSLPAAPAQVILSLRNSAGTAWQCTLALPAGARTSPGPYRFLVTWHQGRWQGQGDPIWRAQTLLQERSPDVLLWRETARLSAWQQPGSELPAAWSADRGQPLAAINAGAGFLPVLYPQVSDYGEPVWLHFIGSMGESVGLPENYRLRIGADNALTLFERNSSTWVPSQLRLPGPGSPNPLAPTSFHLLLVVRPVADLIRGDLAPDSGALIAVYEWCEKGKKPPCAGSFIPFGQRQRSRPGSGDLAYVVTFMHPNTDLAFTPPTSWDEIWQQMFPPAPVQSALRMDARFLGPILLE